MSRGRLLVAVAALALLGVGLSPSSRTAQAAAGSSPKPAKASATTKSVTRPLRPDHVAVQQASFLHPSGERAVFSHSLYGNPPNQSAEPRKQVAHLATPLAPSARSAAVPVDNRIVSVRPGRARRDTAGAASASRQLAPRDATRLTVSFFPKGDFFGRPSRLRAKGSVGLIRRLAAEIDSYRLRQIRRTGPCPAGEGDGIFELGFGTAAHPVTDFSAACGFVLLDSATFKTRWRLYRMPFVYTLARIMRTATHSKSLCHQRWRGHHLRLCRLKL